MIQADALDVLASIASGNVNIREKLIYQYSLRVFTDILTSKEAEVEVVGAAARLVTNLAYSGICFEIINIR